MCCSVLFHFIRIQQQHVILSLSPTLALLLFPSIISIDNDQFSGITLLFCSYDCEKFFFHLIYLIFYLLASKQPMICICLALLLNIFEKLKAECHTDVIENSLWTDVRVLFSCFRLENNKIKHWFIYLFRDHVIHGIRLKWWSLFCTGLTLLQCRKTHIWAKTVSLAFVQQLLPDGNYSPVLRMPCASVKRANLLLIDLALRN